MAKSKNHTAHNQTYKAHRNPVKKVTNRRNPSMKGVDPKYLLNIRMSRRHNKSTLQQRKTFLRRQAEGPKETRPKLR